MEVTYFFIQPEIRHNAALEGLIHKKSFLNCRQDFFLRITLCLHPSFTKVKKLYDFLLSNKTKEKAEKTIIWISILSFLIHLSIIGVIYAGFIPLPFDSALLTNPISAIYTPFTFILLFEVYLLVYHIPLSTSDYIAKQYEIITLIVIRRIFKDLANLDLSIDWFSDKYDLQFTYDIVTTLILVLLIYFFHRLNGKVGSNRSFEELPDKVKVFVRRKQLMSSLLVPVIIVMSVYSFIDWMTSLFSGYESTEGTSFVNLNNIFFDEFFTLLILTDVLLLLFSFFHTSKFHVVIRNSGFIISTILIRISFSIDGFLNNILIIVAVLFGVLILLLNQYYEKLNDKAIT